MSGEGVRERLGKLRILNAHTRSCRPWVVMTGCATASSHKALSSRAELVAPVPVHAMRLLRRCQTHMRECTVPGQQARPHVMPSSRPAGQRRPPLPPPAGERWPVALAADPPLPSPVGADVGGLSDSHADLGVASVLPLPLACMSVCSVVSDLYCQSGVPA